MSSQKLYIFDMDGTLLPHTCGFLEIGKYAKREADFAKVEQGYRFSTLTPEKFTEEARKLLNPLSAEDIENAFTNAKKISNIVPVLDEIRAMGHFSCIITLMGDFFAHHFKPYGFDRIFASHYFNPHDKNSTFYNLLEPEDKPKMAKQLCQELGIRFEDSLAFGDSSSDAPLFQQLNKTISVNGDEHLRPYAAHHYQGNDLMEAFHLSHHL